MRESKNSDREEKIKGGGREKDIRRRRDKEIQRERDRKKKETGIEIQRRVKR